MPDRLVGQPGSLLSAKRCISALFLHNAGLLGPRSEASFLRASIYLRPVDRHDTVGDEIDGLFVRWRRYRFLPLRCCVIQGLGMSVGDLLIST